MSPVPGSPRLAPQTSLHSAAHASPEFGSGVIAPMPLLTTAQRAWKWLRQGGKLAVFAQRNRRLRVSETVSLGEKRFVSLIEIDNISFLIGSSPQNVTLLAQLPPSTQREPFRGVLDEEWNRGSKL